MSATDIAAMLGAAAVLISSLASLVVAIRTGQKVSATHQLVNGASEQINIMREAQGFRAGVIASNPGKISRPEAPAE